MTDTTPWPCPVHPHVMVQVLSYADAKKQRKQFGCRECYDEFKALPDPASMTPAEKVAEIKEWWTNPGRGYTVDLGTMMARWSKLAGRLVSDGEMMFGFEALCDDILKGKKRSTNEAALAALPPDKPVVIVRVPPNRPLIVVEAKP